jgi:hypothetical protein
VDVPGRGADVPMVLKAHFYVKAWKGGDVPRRIGRTKGELNLKLHIVCHGSSKTGGASQHDTTDAPTPSPQTASSQQSSSKHYQ